MPLIILFHSICKHWIICVEFDVFTREHRILLVYANSTDASNPCERRYCGKTMKAFSTAPCVVAESCRQTVSAMRRRKVFSLCSRTWQENCRMHVAPVHSHSESIRSRHDWGETCTQITPVCTTTKTSIASPWTCRNHTTITRMASLPIRLHVIRCCS